MARPCPVRRRLPRAALALALPALAACVQLPERTVTVYGGERAIDSQVWAPVDEQWSFGIETDTRRPDTGWGIELGTMHSEGAAETFIVGLGVVKADATADEYYAGVRKSFGGKGLRTYVGTGLTLIDGEYQARTAGGAIDDSDMSPGIYVHAGALWQAWGNVELGLDYRRVFLAEAHMFGADGNFDGGQLSLILGFGF